MTHQEFNTQLWPYLTARYLQVAHWLGLLPATARHERDTTQSDVLAAWQGILADVALADAKAAIDELVRADPPREFKNLSDFPTAIRAEARRLNGERSRKQNGYGPRIVNGEVTYRCAICLDVGVVTVWHPAAYDAARQRPAEFVEKGQGAYTCAAACKCSIGLARNTLNTKQYDRDTMVRVVGHLREELKQERRELVKLLAIRDEGRGAKNREQGPYDFGQNDLPETI